MFRKFQELEDAVKTHDKKIQVLFKALNQLMSPTKDDKRKIGFKV